MIKEFDFNCSHCKNLIDWKNCFYKKEYHHKNAQDCIDFQITEEANKLEDEFILKQYIEENKEMKALIKVQAQLLEQMGEKNFGGNWGAGEIIHSCMKADNGEFNTAAFIRYDIYLKDKVCLKALLKRSLAILCSNVADCEAMMGYEVPDSLKLVSEIEEALKDPWEKEYDNPAKQKIMDAIDAAIKEMENNER